MRKKILAVMMIMSMVIMAGCGKDNDKDNKTTTKAGIEQNENTMNNDETKDETTTEETEVSEEDDKVEYYNYDCNFSLPMMHEFTNNDVHVNDNTDILIFHLFTRDENGKQNVIELNNVLEACKSNLGNYNSRSLVTEDKEYVIDSCEDYTTKSGLKCLRYEGKLQNESRYYYFYGYVFNGPKTSYEYVAFSTKQVQGEDDSTYNIEDVKKQIKEIMDDSIETVRFDS